MLRDLISVSACLAVLASLAGCRRIPRAEPGEIKPDSFEPDGESGLAKEQPMNAPQQSHTLWPAGDVDFIRFRVNEVDIEGNDGEGPLVFVDLHDEQNVGGWEIYYDHTLITDATLGDYRTPDCGFSVPGIYYVEVSGHTVLSGSYGSLVRMLREGGGPDLVVTSVEPPDEIATGEAVTIRVFIVNQGGADTTAETECAIYASADSELGPEDVLIATESVPVLAKWKPTEGQDWTPCTLEVTIDPFPDLTATTPGIADPEGPIHIMVYVNPDAAGEAMDETRNNNVGLGSCLLDPASSSSTDPIEFSGGPTVTLAEQVLYPADDEETSEVNEADVHDFELQLDAGLNYYEIWTQNLVGRTDTRIELLDSGGQPLDPEVTVEDGGLENGASYLCHDSGFAAGSLTIRVTDENGRAGGYDLVVRASATAPDRFEPDGGMGTWRVLHPGVDPHPVDGLRSFSTDDDEDWVAYPVSAAHHGWKHSILTYDVSGCDTSLEIFKAGSTTAEYTSAETSGAGTLTDIALDAVLYYVRVTGVSDPAGGTYRLKASTPRQP